MRIGRLWAAVAMVAVGLGCRKAETLKPPRALAPGTLMFHFTNKVTGPVDLFIDDVRIAVAKSKKPMRNLVVTGLAPGRHHYFLASPRDAFGPDHGEVEMTPDQGSFLVSFAQHFDAVLYGRPEPPIPTEGLPGVSARMMP
jgi:hypothetical protein